MYESSWLESVEKRGDVACVGKAQTDIGHAGAWNQRRWIMEEADQVLRSIGQLACDECTARKSFKRGAGNARPSTHSGNGVTRCTSISTTGDERSSNPGGSSGYFFLFCVWNVFMTRIQSSKEQKN